MPLILGDGWHLKEQPLTGLVLEGGLVELNLDDIIRMADNTSNLGLTAGTDLAIQTLNQVETSSEELPPPSEITNAVRPKLLPGKWRKSIGCITNEAANGVRVESQEEGDEQMMRVPKGLERLLTDTSMSSGIHEQHAEEHHVAGDTARLRVVNLQGDNGTELFHLYIVEVDIVG